MSPSPITQYSVNTENLPSTDETLRPMFSEGWFYTPNNFYGFEQDGNDSIEFQTWVASWLRKVLKNEDHAMHFIKHTQQGIQNSLQIWLE